VTADDAGRERSDSSAADETAPHPAQASLWEVFLSRDSLVRALRGVEQDAGAAGVDGMTTGGVGRWLEEQWSSVRSRLDAGAYRPRPVGRVTIAKPWGGERLVGVPRALDRLIEQALLQVLTPVFDPCFHRRLLRRSAGTLGRSSGRGGTPVHPGWRGVGGRGRPGRLLRPGRARRVDGASRPPGRRRAGAASDPPLPGGRGARRRDRAGKRAGDATRARRCRRCLRT
jgi:hypothetical protein